MASLPARLPASSAVRREPKIAVVIPCYRVAHQILDVLARIGGDVERIYVVDDRCPEGTGALVRERTADPRVTVIMREENGGVGAATLSGYARAIEDGADIIVKLDGDGQMDPSLIGRFAGPIAEGRADYTKGNRFYHLGDVHSMPWARMLGNAALSFLTKLSTGYWETFDPTNGYTAIDARVARDLPAAKLARRYFFESDVLFRLALMRAVVLDVPMTARYADETSSLRIARIIPEFCWKHLRNVSKRILYNYFLRNFSIASLELVASFVLGSWSLAFGGYRWWLSVQQQIPASAGTVMVAAMPALMAFQLLLSFVNHDISMTPREPIHGRLR